MFANPKALLVIVSCALVAQAQSSGSSTTTTAPASQSSLPAGITPCIYNCSVNALSGTTCTSIADLPCVCTSTAFQTAAAACLVQNCPDEVQAAQAVQSSECAALSSGSVPASTATAASSGTGSVTAATSKASSTTATSSNASSASASATSTSAAMALSAPFSFANLVGTLVASVGALVGAAFVL